MTRESKVGLFVGLSIIILFAVVIADKGQARRVTPADFGSSLADGSRSTRAINGVDRSAASPDEGRLPVDRVLPGPENVVALKPPPVHREPARPERSQEPQGLPELPPSALADGSKSRESFAFNSGPDETADALNNSSTESIKSETVIPPPEDGERGRETPEVLARNESRESRAEREKIEALDRRINERNATDIDESPIKSEKEADTSSKLEKPDDVKRTHTIKSGESLAVIARKYYGSSSMQMVNAIFEANRGTLDDRNAIRAGQALVIPVMAGMSTSSMAMNPTMLKASGTAELPKIPPAEDDERLAVKKPATKSADKKTAPQMKRDNDRKMANGAKKVQPATMRRAEKSTKPSVLSMKKPAASMGSKSKAVSTVADRVKNPRKSTDRDATTKRSPAKRGVPDRNRPSKPASKKANERAADDVLASRANQS